MTPLYSLPSLYDILHTAGTAAEVTGLERMARRFAGPHAAKTNAVWLEPACGTARHLRVAARRGYRVIGIDVSSEMLTYARERFRALKLTRRANLIQGDIVHADTLVGTHRVDFAFNLINSIRHLSSERDCQVHLSAMARALKPSGVYCVGISVSNYGHEQPTEDVWIGTRGRTKITQAIQYIPATARRGTTARFEQVISHLAISRPSGEEHKTLTYNLLSYDRHQWLNLIHRAGLTVKAVVDEKAKDYNPPDLGYAIYILSPN
jgi:SAM-dependent methyltransferase